MKKIKQIIASMLTALTVVSMVASPVTAFAAEADVKNNSAVEFETTVAPGESCSIPDEMISTFGTSTSVDNTFNIGSFHRGGDRAYSTSHLRFTINITDANGNAVSNKVTVALQDYNGNSSGWLIPANGLTQTHSNISIVPERMYFFTYSNPGAQTLRVHMIITPY